jgi:beta-N-acetylhexosaminidase
MAPRAAIVGIEATALTQAERAAFAATPPAGVILFARNIANPAALAALTADLRALLPEPALVMIDQEGGRVARLRPPHWCAHPPAATIGALHAAAPAAGLDHRRADRRRMPRRRDRRGQRPGARSAHSRRP